MNFLVNLILYGLACAVIPDKDTSDNTGTLVALDHHQHNAHDAHEHIDYYEGEQFEDYGSF